MHILVGECATQAGAYFIHAADVALCATCTRSRCGAIIVTPAGNIIGEGFNSPPAGLECERRCTCDKQSYHPKVTDKTCCMHAEQRAIINALGTHPGRILGSTLYFIRLDENGKMKYSGDPYCTVCSKLALDVGIKYFVLNRREGMAVYDTVEYNALSFAYRAP